jgi:hypothetical protein
MLVAHLVAAEQNLGQAIAAGAVPDIVAEGTSSSTTTTTSAGADSTEAGAEAAETEAGGKSAGSRRKRALLPVPQLLPWRAPSVPLAGGFKALVSRCYLMQHPQHHRGNQTRASAAPHTQQKQQKQGQQQQAKVAGGAAGSTAAAGSSGGASAPQMLQVTSRSPSWSWTDVQEDGGTKHKPGWYSQEVGEAV